MTLSKRRPRAVRECSLCNNRSLHIEVVDLEDGKQIEVGRCVICDCPECKECKNRTMDPTARACAHCGADSQIKVKEESD